MYNQRCIKNNSFNSLSKKKLNIAFLISVSIISIITLMLIISLFINSQYVGTLKWPVMLSVIPIYLILRFVFLLIESNKNIPINKTEEIIKALFVFYFLIFISIKFFPLNKIYFKEFLSISFLSYNTLYEWKFIIETFIINFALFIPLGFLTPMIITKFRNIFSCAILGIVLSVIVSSIALLIHSIRLDFVDIISFDLLLSNIIGTIAGYGIYCLVFKKIKGQ
ncbi:VanZ family protein (plasmid) [Clostridium beijerinckii]|uniref:VanZ family protein n=1 Tax=Clostridium beijerinckii TaxID=1520 RepID=UPI002226D151|nr:VanZ family protein [Clostridium beijerinckii]UYZ39013.1 VanZ family protein [Clostridium beijerinckii]